VRKQKPPIDVGPARAEFHPSAELRARVVALQQELAGQRYLHNDAELFMRSIEDVHRESGIPCAIIEHDYYVMHALWCLQRCGLSLRLKGGASLAQGFGVLRRASEDVDVAIDGSEIESLQPSRLSWKDEAAAEARCRWFEQLEYLLAGCIPGCSVHLAQSGELLIDYLWRQGAFFVDYQPRFEYRSYDSFKGSSAQKMQAVRAAQNTRRSADAPPFVHTYGLELENSLFPSVVLEITGATLMPQPPFQQRVPLSSPLHAHLAKQHSPGSDLDSKDQRWHHLSIPTHDSPPSRTLHCRQGRGGTLRVEQVGPCTHQLIIVCTRLVVALI